MSRIELVPCSCDRIDELEGLNLSRAIDPTKFPNGVAAHDSDDFFCSAVWIQNPHSSLTLYFGFGSANDLTQCMAIAPGQDKFWGVVTEAEKLVAIPKLRIRPQRIKLNSTSAMTAVVVLFL